MERGLALEEDGATGGRADWTRVGDEGVGATGICVTDAMALAGEEYADYVRVRTVPRRPGSS